MTPRPPDFFTWIEPQALAAMAWPRNLRQALEFLHDEGIGVVVSLTEFPLQRALVEEFGMEYHHMPIPDFTAPTYEQMCRFVGLVDNALRADKRVVVHCLAGRGRTGTLAACWLVSRGRSSTEAIEEVRRLRPGSVESACQEEAVHEFDYRRRHGED